MQSGSPIPTGNISNGQQDFDVFVMTVGCQDADDKLQCLRDAPYDALVQAMNASPTVLGYKAFSFPLHCNTYVLMVYLGGELAVDSPG